jgi:Flp pilus assembly protein protease CpaA
MRHFCNSLLLCGIACLCVPTAQAQDVTIRRVKTKLTAMMLLTSAIALTVAGTAFIMWGHP